MKFGTNIHQAQMLNFSNFGDPLFFHLAPQVGLSIPLIYDQIDDVNLFN